MSFRKRSVVVGSSGANQVSAPSTASSPQVIPGVRPSPVDGRPTTSTGTQSLDDLLAGHAGLALGTSILIEENGTTDFASSILRHYAAEGIVQGHHVHVLGMPEAWARELPGLAKDDDAVHQETKSAEPMKIAWRYERGDAAAAASRERRTSTDARSPTATAHKFCHSFDLSKRLTLPSTSNLHFRPCTAHQSFPTPGQPPSQSPFTAYITHLHSHLTGTPPSVQHRVAIPSLLSPAIYPPHACLPQHVLAFLHAIRALLRAHSTRLSVMISYPLTLHPRRTGLTRWIELLSDGVFELTPFPATPYSNSTSSASTTSPPPPSTTTNTTTPSSSATSSTAHRPETFTPQGLLSIHRLPIFHETGGGGSATLVENYAFALSRRRGLVLRPYSLPPVEGDRAAQEGEDEEAVEHGRKQRQRPAGEAARGGRGGRADLALDHADKAGDADDDDGGGGAAAKSASPEQTRKPGKVRFSAKDLEF